MPTLTTAGPPKHVLLGHALGLLPDRLGFFTECAARYGDVVNLSLGRPTYLLIHPDDIKYVLETRHRNYTKTRRLTGASGKAVVGDGLMTSSGQPAIDTRRRLAAIAAPSTAARFGDMVVTCTHEMIAGWPPNGTVNMAEEMMTLAQRILGKALFSVDFLHEGQEVADAITLRRQYLEQHFSPLGPIRALLPTRLNRDHRRAVARLDAQIHAMIRARRDSASPPEDLLTLLLHAKGKEGGAMTDKEVCDEARALATAGYITIGAALGWTWFLLSQNPEVESRLCKELQAVLAGRSPSAADIPALRYAEMVLEEAMRLYPPTWIFVRMALVEDRLPSGAHIPAGSKLYVCPYVTHRDPRYFPDPCRFDPERFGATAARSKPRFAYFPFGGGPRICLGEGFAMLECVLVVATVAQHVRLSIVPGQTVIPKPARTLMPKDGIRMRVTPR